MATEDTISLVSIRRPRGREREERESELRERSREIKDLQKK
jgi:hypothetical protein